MVLNLQLKSIIVSFSYGIIIAYLIKLNYKYLFTKNLILKILVDTLFSIDLFLLYFILLKIISNASFHIYFLFIIIVGYVLGYKLINNNTLH